MHRRYKRWTKEDKLEIQRMWNEGATADEIAAHLKTTKQIIFGMITYMRNSGYDMKIRSYVKQKNAIYNFKLKQNGNQIQETK